MYVIKHLPEDFVVEEILEKEFKRNGRFLVIKVTKRERNSDEVAQLLARMLRLPRAALGYAGAKDRRALTTQYFSLRGVSGEALETALERRRRESDGLRDVQILPVGYLDEPLGLGALEGNRFTITLRGLDGTESLLLPNSIPNYFDEQRFSANNAAIGEALVRKRFTEAIGLLRETDAPETRLIDEHLTEHAGDVVGALLHVPRQLLKMYLHAYQSLLWNRALAEYIRTTVKTTRDIPYSQGTLLFCERSEIVQNISLPIPGFSMTTGSARDDSTTADSTNDDSTGSCSTNNSSERGSITTTFEYLMERILGQEGLTPRDFVIKQLPNLSLEGGSRDALIAVKEFSVSTFVDDDQFPGKKRAMVSFALPKGSYATMVIKALFA